MGINEDEQRGWKVLGTGIGLSALSLGCSHRRWVVFIVVGLFAPSLGCLHCRWVVRTVVGSFTPSLSCPHRSWVLASPLGLCTLVRCVGWGVTWRVRRCLPHELAAIAMWPRYILAKVRQSGWRCGSRKCQVLASLVWLLVNVVSGGAS